MLSLEKVISLVREIDEKYIAHRRLEKFVNTANSKGTHNISVGIYGNEFKTGIILGEKIIEVMNEQKNDLIKEIGRLEDKLKDMIK